MGQANGKAAGVRETKYSGCGELFTTEDKEMSVFVLQTGSAEEKARADTYEAKLKSLRSPDILRFKRAVSVAPDKRWLVTERVVPLEAVKESLTYSQLVLAMHHVLRALHFLHTNAHVSHNALSLASIFVHYDDVAMPMFPQFRLGGLQQCDSVAFANGGVSAYAEPPESPVPRAKAGALPIHSRDVWHLTFMLQQLLESSESRMAAVGALCKVLRNPEPGLRPTAAEILRFPFFEHDPIIRCVSFLESFRAASPHDRMRFFSELPQLLARLGDDPRDLSQTVLPLLMQGDVMVDPCCEPFMEAAINEFPTSAVSEAIVAHLVSMFGSRERSLRTAALLKLSLLLPALRRAPSTCSASVAVIVMHLLDCFHDTDRQLNLAATRAVVVLCQFWCNVHDETSLNRINAEFLPLLSNMANADADPAVRAEVCEAVASLIVSFERINGVLAIKTVVGCLLDVDDTVKLAALRSVQQLQPLLPSLLAVTHVLPNLVRLLVSRNVAVRHTTARLVQAFAEVASRASDTSTWPEVPPGVQWPVHETAPALPKSAIFVGSSVAHSSGALRSVSSVSTPARATVVASHVLREAKAEAVGHVNGDHDDDNDDDDDEGEGEGEWGAVSWADKQVAASKAPPSEGDSGLFQGLTLASEPDDAAAQSQPHAGSAMAAEATVAANTDPTGPLPPLRPRGQSFASGPPIPARGSPPLVAGLDDLLRRSSSDSEDGAAAAARKSTAAALAPSLASAAASPGWFQPIADDDDDDDDDDDGGGAGLRFDESAWKSVKKDEIFSVNVVPVRAASPVRPSASDRAESAIVAPTAIASLGRLSLAEGPVTFSAPPAALALQLDLGAVDDGNAGEGWGSDDLALALDTSLSAQPEAVAHAALSAPTPNSKDGWGDFDADSDDGQ